MSDVSFPAELVVVEKSEFLAVVEVDCAPEGSERGHVVGVDAGDGVDRDGSDGLVVVVSDFVLDDEHASDVVREQGPLHFRRDGAKVLADEPGSVAM